jgi:uncharacterized protein YbjQ (UPF0145 family)
MDNFDDLERLVRLSGTRFTGWDKAKLAAYKEGCGELYCRHACGECEPSCPHGVPVNTIMRFNHYFETQDGHQMIVTNIETIPGKTIVEHFGLVSGSTIRAKHIGRDLMASLKNLVGGELKGYTQLMAESRRQATERMIAQARQIGANAIVNVRYSTSSVAQGAAELYAYGTAVKIV